jgi:hypothetical protein
MLFGVQTPQARQLINCLGMGIERHGRSFEAYTLQEPVEEFRSGRVRYSGIKGKGYLHLSSLRQGLLVVEAFHLRRERIDEPRRAPNPFFNNQVLGTATAFKRPGNRGIARQTALQPRYDLQGSARSVRFRIRWRVSASRTSFWTSLLRQSGDVLENNQMLVPLLSADGERSRASCAGLGWKLGRDFVSEFAVDLGLIWPTSVLDCPTAGWRGRTGSDPPSRRAQP